MQIVQNSYMKGYLNRGPGMQQESAEQRGQPTSGGASQK